MAKIALAASCASLVAQQHLPSNEDLRQLRSISSPQLSPDLKHLVVTVQDSTADGGKSHLWLLSTEGETYRQLTFAQDDVSGERTPEYLPDGSAILFVSKHKDTTNLYRLPLHGGEAVAVKLERAPAPGEPALPVHVVSYTISPDGQKVAVVATDPEGQSQEMYRALRQEGVPVQLLLFPREDHAMLGGNFSGQPSTERWHGVIARDHMLHFIADAFVGNVEPNKP